MDVPKGIRNAECGIESVAAGDRRSPLQAQRKRSVEASRRTTPSVSHSADSYPQPQSARASSLVSVDSLSSLFVATGDARIAHLGEGALVTSPASRRNRICAVTPAKRKPTRSSPNGFRKGRSPFAGFPRAAPLGGLSGQRPDRSSEAEPLVISSARNMRWGRACGGSACRGRRRAWCRGSGPWAELRCARPSWRPLP